MIHKASSRRRWAALTSGALLAGGLVAGPALLGASTASAAPVTLDYTCTVVGGGQTVPQDSTIAVEMTAPAAVAPGDEFSAKFAVTIDMGTAAFGPIQALTGPFDIPVTIGGKTTVVKLPSSTAPVSHLVFSGTATGKFTAPASVGAAPATLGTPVGNLTTTPFDAPTVTTCVPDAGQDQTVGTVNVSEAADPAIKVLSAPTVSGAAKVGTKLTVVAGSYDPADVDLAYRWLRNGTAIAGATAASYTPVAGDVDRTLAVEVTASKTDYASVESTPEAGTVAAGKLAVSGTAKVTGKAKVGKKLTVKAAKVSGAKVTYQWLANGKAIKKATKSTLKLSKALKGKKVSARVTYAKVGYAKTVQTTKSVKVK